MSLNQILATIALVIFIIYAVFNIIYLIDLRKTSLALRQFVAKTEENLNPALIELRLALEDIRKITSDAAVLTQKLRTAAGTIVTVEKSIQTLYGFYRDSFGQSANANISAVKAGVKAGVVNLLKNLKAKKEEHHE